MRVRKLSTLGATVAILAVTVFVTSAWSVTEKMLHDFNGNDGANPGGLVFDASGNLYGTTYYGGDNTCSDGNGVGCGTVFELSPKKGGDWTEKVLHTFSKKDPAGFNPPDGVILDASGNLYGMTSAGSHWGCGYGNLCGTVFELTPMAGGKWQETVLHAFRPDGKDGYNPRAGLIFDNSGNLYGATWYGGTGRCFDGNGRGCGTVFELTHNTSGVWTETILYDFANFPKDGIWPTGRLTLDASGNVYGTNYEDGVGGYGTVFELTPKAGGGWAEKILHSFNGKGKDGNSPNGSLIFDASGSLYGTTYYGPPQGYDGPCQDGTDLGCGVVFELTPKAGGGWAEKILHKFKSNGKDGFHPPTNLTFDASGNFYSTTSWGGFYSGGTIFALIPKAGGGWMEKILYAFNYNGKDGFSPNTLIFDASGNLYGTTSFGGAGNCFNSRSGGCGTVFEIIP